MEGQDIKKRLLDFVTQRDWVRYHNPKDLTLAIFIEMAELAEHFLWKSNDSIEEYLGHEQNMNGILEEIADILIYSLNMINAIERISGKSIDVRKIIEDKILKNSKKYPVDECRKKGF
ncbi:nucleotide pyrophosphohydrolase [Candidatus Bathyarchaeota archaeon]|nr:nucleotide pyrophosphohydrolase [Candidatus Bathyarchaeota archaeon]